MKSCFVVTDKFGQLIDASFEPFLTTAGYFRNKNVLKHEAEMLEKNKNILRTF